MARLVMALIWASCIACKLALLCLLAATLICTTRQGFAPKPHADRRGPGLNHCIGFTTDGPVQVPVLLAAAAGGVEAGVEVGVGVGDGSDGLSKGTGKETSGRRSSSASAAESCEQDRRRSSQILKHKARTCMVRTTRLRYSCILKFALASRHRRRKRAQRLCA